MMDHKICFYGINMDIYPKIILVIWSTAANLSKEIDNYITGS